MNQWKLFVLGLILFISSSGGAAVTDYLGCSDVTPLAELLQFKKTQQIQACPIDSSSKTITQTAQIENIEDVQREIAKRGLFDVLKEEILADQVINQLKTQEFLASGQTQQKWDEATAYKSCINPHNYPFAHAQLKKYIEIHNEKYANLYKEEFKRKKVQEFKEYKQNLIESSTRALTLEKEVSVLGKKKAYLESRKDYLQKDYNDVSEELNFAYVELYSIYNLYPILKLPLSTNNIALLDETKSLAYFLDNLEERQKNFKEDQEKREKIEDELIVVQEKIRQIENAHYDPEDQPRMKDSLQKLKKRVINFTNQLSARPLSEPTLEGHSMDYWVDKRINDALLKAFETAKKNITDIYCSMEYSEDNLKALLSLDPLREKTLKRLSNPLFVAVACEMVEEMRRDPNWLEKTGYALYVGGTIAACLGGAIATEGIATSILVPLCAGLTVAGTYQLYDGYNKAVAANEKYKMIHNFMTSSAYDPGLKLSKEEIEAYEASQSVFLATLVTAGLTVIDLFPLAKGGSEIIGVIRKLKAVGASNVKTATAAALKSRLVGTAEEGAFANWVTQLQKALQKEGEDASSDTITGLWKIHTSTRGQLGPDGGPAGLGNFTSAQLIHKEREVLGLVREGRLKRDTAQKLLDEGILGERPQKLTYRDRLSLAAQTAKEESKPRVYIRAVEELDKEYKQMIGEISDDFSELKGVIKEMGEGLSNQKAVAQADFLDAYRRYQGAEARLNNPNLSFREWRKTKKEPRMPHWAEEPEGVKAFPSEMPPVLKAPSSEAAKGERVTLLTELETKALEEEKRLSQLPPQQRVKQQAIARRNYDEYMRRLSKDHQEALKKTFQEIDENSILGKELKDIQEAIDSMGRPEMFTSYGEGVKKLGKLRERAKLQSEFLDRYEEYKRLQQSGRAPVQPMPVPIKIEPEIPLPKRQQQFQVLFEREYLDGNNQYISFLPDGTNQRMAGRIVDVVKGKKGITIKVQYMDQNGKLSPSKTLSLNEFFSVATSSIAKEGLKQHFYGNLLPLQQQVRKIFSEQDYMAWRGRQLREEAGRIEEAQNFRQRFGAGQQTEARMTRFIQKPLTIKELQPDQRYMWIINDRGELKFMPYRTDVGGETSKHIALAEGHPVFAAGEARVDERGKIYMDLQSGTYMGYLPPEVQENLLPKVKKAVKVLTDEDVIVGIKNPSSKIQQPLPVGAKPQGKVIKFPKHNTIVAVLRNGDGRKFEIKALPG